MKLTKIRIGLSRDPRCPRIDIYMHYDNGHEESGDFAQGFPGPVDGIEDAEIDSSGMPVPLKVSDLQESYVNLLYKCRLCEVPALGHAVIGWDDLDTYQRVVEARYGVGAAERVAQRIRDLQPQYVWDCIPPVEACA